MANKLYLICPAPEQNPVEYIWLKAN